LIIAGDAQMILLTGAFGNVGESTLIHLIEKGYTVRIFDLDTDENRKKAQKYQDHIEVMWGDIRNIKDVKKAVKDIDVVIHVAAVIPPLADKNPELARAVNVEGTKNIVKALHPETRLIYTSSVSVYGDRVDNPFITVDDPVHPNEEDEYAKTKVAAEKIVMNSGVLWVIFRLTYIVSPEKLEMDPLMFHMPLNTCIEVCHTQDTGKALANAVGNDMVWGKIFHIAGGEKCRTTYREYLNRMMDIFGLGENWLPEEAFSTGKFHCGYMDTAESQELLQYQEHTIEDYYTEVKNQVGYKQWVTKLFQWAARVHVLSKSPFYRECSKKRIMEFTSLNT
jgi:nucleoside-diphosphate-sugar epimerase